MPLLWLSLAFIAGILLGDILHLSWTLWLGLGIASLAVWLILRRLTPVRLDNPRLNRFAHSAGGLSLPAAALVLAVFAGGMRYQLAHPALTAQDIAFYNGRGVLLITPGDREDMLLAAGATTLPNSPDNMAGIVLTGGLRPGESILRALQTLPVPVLLAQADSYQVASKVHNLIVKTRPADAEKISLIRDLVAKHINVKKIIESL